MDENETRMDRNKTVEHAKALSHESLEEFEAADAEGRAALQRHDRDALSHALDAESEALKKQIRAVEEFQQAIEQAKSRTK